jgi:hypothetical protein
MLLDRDVESNFSDPFKHFLKLFFHLDYQHEGSDQVPVYTSSSSSEEEKKEEESKKEVSNGILFGVMYQ